MTKNLLPAFFLLVCLFAFRPPASAQGSAADRKDLHDLLEQRRNKFDAYSVSLAKRSGFFGNKTKKDMQHSNDVLLEIVETDNHIITALNRVIDFHTFEKTNRNYTFFQNDERVHNLLQATDTLTKQADSLAISNASLKTTITKLKWMNYLLIFLVCWLIVSKLRKKKQPI